MYNEDELIPISALQHMAFCERQCALIYVEQSWAENRLTAQGRVLHERVHAEGGETRPGIRVVRSLRLRSLRYGLTGIADVVEFHASEDGGLVPGLPGRWKPYPIEYKHGRPKGDFSDEMQLCAQAVCLEEMLGCAIVEGSVFYGKLRRRHAVVFDAALRTRFERLAIKAHNLIKGGHTPHAVYSPKCDNCSLYELCKPRTAGAGKSAKRYLGQMLAT